MSSFQRVLVKLHKKDDITSPRLANFSECILKYFGFDDGEGDVHIQMKDYYLTISDSKLTDGDNILLKHPVFCPVCHISQEEATSLPEEVKNRGVDVGAAIALESCDGKILLTRRAHHMKIFPGLWTIPGGHVEENENLLDAGLRELKEETGLDLKRVDCVGEKIDLLTIWESVYPAKLSVGPPTHHHIVAYFHAKLKEGLPGDLMESQIHFDPNEVDACAWVDRQIAMSIGQSYEEAHDIPAKHENLPSSFRAVVLDSDNHQKITDLSSTPLVRVMTEGKDDIERVSMGTKFALRRFLNL